MSKCSTHGVEFCAQLCFSSLIYIYPHLINEVIHKLKVNQNDESTNTEIVSKERILDGLDTKEERKGVNEDTRREFKEEMNEIDREIQERGHGSKEKRDCCQETESVNQKDEQNRLNAALTDLRIVMIQPSLWNLSLIFSSIRLPQVNFIF